jgi:hypothetical protein
MPLVQIMMNRVLTPEEGQTLLAAMNKEIQDRAPTETYQVLHLPGQTRRENPFPEWFQQDIVKSQCSYDEINLVYRRRFESEDAAVKFMRWFENMFRPYCERRGGADFAKNLQIRVMDEHDWIAGSDSF